MEFGSFISTFKDVVIAIAACTTACVAFIGLNKWQKELKGKVYFDTARDLIRAVYNFRDNMSYSRNAFITPLEFPKDYDHFNKEAKKEGDAFVYIYQNRMKPLTESAKELDVHRLEAEALWGKEIKEKCFRLRRTYFRLQHAMQSDIEDIYSSRENFKDASDLKKEIRADLFESNKNDDSLSKEIAEAILDIESIVRPYLDKKI